MRFPVIDTKATGENLKSLMKERGYSVGDVKEFLGIGDKSNIYKWFRGETLPAIDNLLALSKILGVTINDMIVADMAA